MKTFILLAGASGAGKSSLAFFLRNLGYNHESSSAYLSNLSGINRTPENLASLYAFGKQLDDTNPFWLYNSAKEYSGSLVVVDAIRSDVQLHSFLDTARYIPMRVIRVNILSRVDELERRNVGRGSIPDTYLFRNADYTWESDREPTISFINRLTGGCVVDAVIGGQYGSEGKGKLVDLLSQRYRAVVRSGGPNAGHWVRKDSGSYCFHQVPSAALSNRECRLYIAAGATVHGGLLRQEVTEVGCEDRIYIDANAVMIEEEDRIREHSGLVASVGSTASGAGMATARRVMRGSLGKVRTASSWGPSGIPTCRVSDAIARHVAMGEPVLLEGTQGSLLSLQHGRYPYVTSRDCNISGLLSECGVAPQLLRDVWLVVRTFPIRVAGNSGTLPGETTWDQVAISSGRTVESLKDSEITSTTKRQRRVGNFSIVDFHEAVKMNRPTKIFVTFGDYLAPEIRGVTEWEKLPAAAHTFFITLEAIAGAPVVGVSTGPMDTDVAWKPGFRPTLVGE